MALSAVLIAVSTGLAVAGGRHVEAAAIAGLWLAIAAVWFVRGRQAPAR
ncbi:hypothetical protein BH760_gp78 [Gordonia phage Splinter]|uniref:Uncharacterized protein n=2 Tax=Vendettavirus vendetta TaxID=2049886 RepID=A0A160DCZ8_9CAUD|nr:hypothetical protein BH795_gp78 [Gordonia phage Vendetta]YP_009275387.1 hypothetical protein BH760_gp78 [Gordonia phage Splinter]ANA85580.1 hypothetical protein PBI_VENDETTA_33 [Gordonia phage Vendetta]ANA85659.1 hypothetical protein PBI_SPLINTER_33 [Gordonia phage Splinter]